MTGIKLGAVRRLQPQRLDIDPVRTLGGMPVQILGIVPGQVRGASFSSDIIFA